MSVTFNAEKMYTYLRGLCNGLGFKDSLNALTFARKAHDGQYRKDGEPYIVHPLTLANHAVSLGLTEDSIIAACLLHDVVEDCGVTITALPISERTQYTVGRLTHIKTVPLDVYYKEISTDRVASIVKILDRCHNVSTMAGVFTEAKCRSYIEETRNYVLPLLRTAKEQWPADSDVLFVLKYHIQSVIDGLEVCLNLKGDEDDSRS